MQFNIWNGGKTFSDSKTLKDSPIISLNSSPFVSKQAKN